MSEQREALHIRAPKELKDRLREYVESTREYRSMTHFVEVAITQKLEESTSDSNDKRPV